MLTGTGLFGREGKEVTGRVHGHEGWGFLIIRYHGEGLYRR